MIILCGFDFKIFLFDVVDLEWIVVLCCEWGVKDVNIKVIFLFGCFICWKG